jgi:hypothetical protein
MRTCEEAKATLIATLDERSVGAPGGVVVLSRVSAMTATESSQSWSGATAACSASRLLIAVACMCGCSSTVGETNDSGDVAVADEAASADTSDAMGEARSDAAESGTDASPCPYPRPTSGASCESLGVRCSAQCVCGVQDGYDMACVAAGGGEAVWSGVLEPKEHCCGN